MVTMADTATLVHTLALAAGARRILEIGTGSGHTAVMLAGTLPADGMMITMEIDGAAAALARERVAAAGHADRISVMVGDAARFLHKIAGPFDLIFQDSDPAKYDQMLDRLVELLRPGGVLVVAGGIGQGEGEFSRRLAADGRLHTAYLPVGSGLMVSVKRAS